MKIVFMGTPDFAQKSLEKLHKEGYDILGVVTNSDKPKGRGMKIISTPVKQYAEKNNLKIYQPIKVRGNGDFIEEINKLEPDILCVVAYGKILPKEILDIPKYGSINVHGSLLPKYRGAAPIQWAVINGEKETGVTTMFMDEGMDTGDMLLKETVEIGEDETTGELWERLGDIGAALLVQTIKKIEVAIQNSNVSEMMEDKKCNNEDVKNKIKELIGAEKQGKDFSVAPMLKKEMAKIDWSQSAESIHNLVRGLNPIMGAFSTLNNKKIKIWKTSKVNEDKSQNRKNGEIILVSKNELLVKTGDGIISIIEIQPENKAKMKIKDFLNGFKITEGELFL